MVRLLIITLKICSYNPFYSMLRKEVPLKEQEEEGVTPPGGCLQVHTQCAQRQFQEGDHVGSRAAKANRCAARIF